MRKIKIFLTLILLSWLFADNLFATLEDSIFYINGAQNKIYKKNASDTSDGSAVNTLQPLHLKIDKDGDFLYYQEWTSGRIYKKSTVGTSDGSQITSISGYPTYIFNAKDFILYQNGDKCYKKSSNDSLSGTGIITGVGDYECIMSPAEDYVYYINNNDGNKLYKKSSYDTLTGSAITTNSVDGAFDISNDGEYIIFTNATDGNKLYKKSSSDTSNGSAITSVNSTFGLYFGKNIIIPTCTDGIQNQDEIGIDYGGVCTAQEEYTFDGCKTRDILLYGTGGTRTEYQMGGPASYMFMATTDSTADAWLNIFGLNDVNQELLQWASGDGANIDTFNVYDLKFPNGVEAEFTTPSVLSGSVSVKSGGPITNIRADGYTPPSILINRISNGNFVEFNYLKFSGASYIKKSVGSQENIAGVVTFQTKNGNVTSPLTLSGGVAMAILHDGLMAESAIVLLTPIQANFQGTYFQFSGFEFGVLMLAETVTECGNGDFKCKMYTQSYDTDPVCLPDSKSILGIGEACVFTNAFTTPIIINDAGDITTVTGNACIPNRKTGTIVTPDGFEVDYIVDGSGNVLQSNTRPIDKGEFTEECLTSDPGILEYIKCGFQFVGNKISQVGTTNDQTNKIVSQVTTIAKQNDSLTGTIHLGQSEAQNGSSTMINAMQSQYVNLKNGDDSFADVFKMFLYTLGAVLTIILVLIFFSLSRKK